MQAADTHTFWQYLPEPARPYGVYLWKTYNFQAVLSRPRRSRLGDFRVLPTGQTLITVNENLNPYAFLITYVHEVAHAHVHRTYRRRYAPHGSMWQKAFQALMQPLVNASVFPAEVVQPLTVYLQKPTATTHTHSALILALQQYDAATDYPASRLPLQQLSEGQRFRLHKKTYVRGMHRRTRIVCKEEQTGKSYAILAHALVETL